MDPSLRHQTHGKIRPMEEPRCGLRILAHVIAAVITIGLVVVLPLVIILT